MWNTDTYTTLTLTWHTDNNLKNVSGWMWRHVLESCQCLDTRHTSIQSVGVAYSLTNIY